MCVLLLCAAAANWYLVSHFKLNVLGKHV